MTLLQVRFGMSQKSGDGQLQLSPFPLARRADYMLAGVCFRKKKNLRHSVLRASIQAWLLVLYGKGWSGLTIAGKATYMLDFWVKTKICSQGLRCGCNERDTCISEIWVPARLLV